MFDWTWITTTDTALLMVILKALGIYAALMLFTRLSGLRSFSKMSTFDFAITVSFGTVLASTLLTKDPPLLQGIAGLAALYGIQFAVSVLRRHFRTIERLVDNEPLLLMAGEEVLHENLRRARITLDDLRAKLREANVIHPRQVQAVVLERTGDISVLHAGPDAPRLDPDLLAEVRGSERLRGKEG